MRRLPIYFLIDVSESMVGEPIEQVQDGMATIVKELRTDPYALETVWVSVIVFAGQPKTIAPLQEIISFYPPKFPIGGGTSLCFGLGYLMHALKKNTVPTTAEQKGDWKPIIFLFTDGVPTDNPSDLQVVISEWKQKWQRSVNLVVVSFGKHTDNKILSELTEHVLHFDNADVNAYKQFFEWVTSSIKTSSLSVENNSTGFELAKLDNKTITKVDLTKHTKEIIIDDNFVVLAAKCQNTKKTYLIKYQKNVFEDNMGDIKMNYKLVGAFRIDDSYFELSDENACNLKISTNKLIGAPTCPCCGNQFAFAMCECGKVHCIDGGGQATCPWCGAVGFYGSGGEEFDVIRTQG